MHPPESDRQPQDLNALRQRLNDIRVRSGSACAMALKAAESLGTKAERSQDPLRSHLLLRMQRWLDRARQLESMGLDGAGPEADPLAVSPRQRWNDEFHPQLHVREPAVLPEMRRIHARIKARQQLKSSLAQSLGHAGPLHSERLVQQSLHRMFAVSDLYLQRFMGYVDALVMMEDAGLPSKRAVPGQAKKTGRS
jgi:hypothetical protein